MGAVWTGKDFGLVLKELMGLSSLGLVWIDPSPPVEVRFTTSPFHSIFTIISAMINQSNLNF